MDAIYDASQLYHASVDTEQKPNQFGSETPPWPHKRRRVADTTRPIGALVGGEILDSIQTPYQ